MHQIPHLPQIVMLLAAAVLSVALCKRAKISSVIGYLCAGALIGPYALGLIQTADATNAFAEFGVVFLLFLIGLELSFQRLIKMRLHVFGFGTLQCVATAFVIGIVLTWFGHTPSVALLIGGALALSSTAVVLEYLQETGERSSQVGRLALAVLILQDLAVIPLLIAVPYLARGEGSFAEALARAGLNAVLALGMMFALGYALLRPAFRFIASLDSHDLFFATALLLVVGMSWLTYSLGLSLALGAFLAGLMMAETEFRPQVEADILPFKGLLLGLFFMTVGMALNLEIVFQHFGLILLGSLGLMIGKAIIIILLCRAFGFGLAASVNAGVLLSQGGEFAFVLLSLASAEGVVPASTAQVTIVIVTFTMALTPLAAMLGKWIAARLNQSTMARSTATISEEMLDITDHVVIAGFGRVGHTVARLLEAENIRYVAVDMNAESVNKERMNGMPVYYGDASRMHVLKAIGLERARAVIITHSDTRFARQTIQTIRELSSELPIVARAKNIEQVRRLERVGANLAVAEMFETSLQLGGALLKQLDVADHEVNRIIEMFRESDYALTRSAEAPE